MSTQRRTRPIPGQNHEPDWVIDRFKSLIAERAARGENDGVKTNTRINPREWSLPVPEPKFGTLDLTFFPYQKELYEQGWDDDEGVVMKCSQVGASAWLIRWAMFWPDTLGRTALYVFPKEKQLADFSNQRIRPLIRAVRVPPRARPAGADQQRPPAADRPTVGSTCAARTSVDGVGVGRR